MKKETIKNNKARAWRSQVSYPIEATLTHLKSFDGERWFKVVVVYERPDKDRVRTVKQFDNLELARSFQRQAIRSYRGPQ